MIESLLTPAIEVVERGLVPDVLVRAGIRALLAQRLRLEGRGGTEEIQRRQERLVERLRTGPLALAPERANEQHYELPPGFFVRVLGANLKYSCCYWADGTRTLDEAENAALAITCQRAGLANGQQVLELGCGWGSLTLWMARRFPGSRILAVSNSASQREFILRKASQQAVRNVSVVTADMNEFMTRERFDRVVSIEMFEHMRNYQELLRRIAGWLRPGGRLFVHVFSHGRHAYLFDTEGAGNWMGRHFFTGGLMPSHDLLPQFQDDLTLVDRWQWSGRHYQRTAEAWLANLDRRKAEIVPLLADVYGARQAHRWFVRWRLFFLAVSEMFGYRDGREWGISHYLFSR